MVDIFKTFTTTEFTTQPNINGLDFVARVSRQTASSVTTVAMMDTHHFMSRIIEMQSEWKRDVLALNDVVNWQHKVIDFNSSYSAYLLDQIEEEEFERIAEQMAEEERDVAPEELVPIVARLLRLTSIEFTASDLANLFNCSVESVDEALHMIPKFLVADRPRLLGSVE
ncbi:hypothetical protein [Pseudomonas syringae]|uniref:hypothetical protein n=1 Tax=Pseudomonas syringae TaxID=317 RepID=UPI00320485BF